MSFLHRRVNNRVAEKLILGGLFDDKKNENASRLYWGIADHDNKRLHRYHRSSPQRWRSSNGFSQALLSAIKDYHIPVWFLKRATPYIIENCLWEKTIDHNTNSVFFEDEIELMEGMLKMQNVGGNGHFILKSADIPTKIERSKMKSVTINNKNYFESVDYFATCIHIDTTNEMGIVVGDIANMYRNVQHRFYRIFGVECKMCCKNVKHKKTDIICNDLAKYIDNICPSCLKKVCKSLPQ
jgi:hypothetical protein